MQPPLPDLYRDKIVHCNLPAPGQCVEVFTANYQLEIAVYTGWKELDMIVTYILRALPPTRRAVATIISVLW